MTNNFLPHAITARIEGDGPFDYRPRSPSRNLAFALAFLVNRWERQDQKIRRSYESLLDDIERNLND